MKNQYENTRHSHVGKGIIDAIVDIGRDLEASGQIDEYVLDNDGTSRRTIIKCIEKRIGKPSDTGAAAPALSAYMKKHVSREIQWSEGRSAGYLYLLRMLCYFDCGSGSGRALIMIGREMDDLYGDENPNVSSMENLVDMIAERIGSPPEADEGYADGYTNMLRFISNLAYLHGI